MQCPAFDNSYLMLEVQNSLPHAITNVLCDVTGLGHGDFSSDGKHIEPLNAGAGAGGLSLSLSSGRAG